MEQKTHWKKLNNPDYLGAYALNPGEDLIVTIDYVRQEKVIGTDGKKEECSVMHFSERGIKPLILNSTNSKTVEKLVGSPYIEDWKNHKIQLYVDKVKAFGDYVDALRVRPFLPKEETYTCADCNQPITEAHGMTGQQVAAYTHKQYGRTLCAACGAKAKAAAAAEKTEGDVLS